MLKFLPGILLIQLVTAWLVYMTVSLPHDPQLIILIFTLALIVAVLFSFWFGSIVRDMQKSSHAKLQAKHAKERERLLLKNERDKAKVTAASYDKIEKASRNIHAKANFKIGAAFAAAIGAGGIMILSQLVTLGMMILVASGSGLAGYIIRVRQERLSSESQHSLRNANDPVALTDKKSAHKNKQLKTSK